jgi:hypothetical protein
MAGEGASVGDAAVDGNAIKKKMEEKECQAGQLFGVEKGKTNNTREKLPCQKVLVIYAFHTHSSLVSSLVAAAAADVDLCLLASVLWLQKTPRASFNCKITVHPGCRLSLQGMLSVEYVYL